MGSKRKNKDMARALAKFEYLKKAHLDAEAVHAAAVKHIGHPQHEMKTCRNAQGMAPPTTGACPKVKTIAHGSCKKEHVDLDSCIGNASKQTKSRKRSDDHKYVHPFVPAGKKTCVCSYA